jgi:hypothetical protein
MSRFIEGLSAQDQCFIGAPAQNLVNVSRLEHLLDTRGIESPISGDHTALYVSFEARLWVHDC